MVECFALDEIANKLEEKQAKLEEAKSVPTTQTPVVIVKTLDFNQVVTIMILSCILVLSIAAVVYAVRQQ